MVNSRHDVALLPHAGARERATHRVRPEPFKKEAAGLAGPETDPAACAVPAGGRGRAGDVGVLLDASNSRCDEITE